MKSWIIVLGLCTSFSPSLRVGTSNIPLCRWTTEVHRGKIVCAHYTSSNGGTKGEIHSLTSELCSWPAWCSQRFLFFHLQRKRASFNFYPFWQLFKYFNRTFMCSRAPSPHPSLLPVGIPKFFQMFPQRHISRPFTILVPSLYWWLP